MMGHEKLLLPWSETEVIQRKWFQGIEVCSLRRDGTHRWGTRLPRFTETLGEPLSMLTGGEMRGVVSTRPQAPSWGCALGLQRTGWELAWEAKAPASLSSVPLQVGSRWRRGVGQESHLACPICSSEYGYTAVRRFQNIVPENDRNTQEPSVFSRCQLFQPDLQIQHNPNLRNGIVGCDFLLFLFDMVAELIFKKSFLQTANSVTLSTRVVNFLNV